ncbi:UNVERIFIED_CONTAM: hypothetical protein K2H54_017101 [Gekko kuhli]
MRRQQSNENLVHRFSVVSQSVMGVRHQEWPQQQGKQPPCKQQQAAGVVHCSRRTRRLSIIFYSSVWHSWEVPNSPVKNTILTGIELLSRFGNLAFL